MARQAFRPSDESTLKPLVLEIDETLFLELGAPSRTECAGPPASGGFLLPSDTGSVKDPLGVHKIFVQGGSGACGRTSLLTHQQFLGRNSLGVRFTSVSKDTTSMREELEAIRRGFSVLGDPRAVGTPSKGIAQKARGPCFGFSSPKTKSEEKTKPPTTQSTATGLSSKPG